MSFVGFLVKKKDEKCYEKILKDIIQECPISINEKSISNIKNVHFETIILDRNIKDMYENDLNELIKCSDYLVVNADKVDMTKIKNINITTITYGFKNKSTITASSAEDENMLICLQRSITSINERENEPQELNIHVQEKLKDPYLKMSLGTIKLLYS